MKYYCEDPELNQLYREHADDAGFDICSAEDWELVNPSWVLVKTKLHVSIPRGHVGILKARSGLSVRFNTDIHAGVIDASYRGEIGVLVSTNKPPLVIHKGDRIAQLLVLACDTNPPIKVNSLEELGQTDRGGKGFGSTGGF